MRNNAQIESLISFDDNLKLYKVELPWIIRYFEDVFYSFEWKNKKYFKDKNINLFGDLFSINNILLWITRFYNYYVVCFIFLDNLESEYYFLEEFNFINYNLGPYKYYVLIYKNYNWIVSYKTDLINWDFESSLNNNNFIVKNNIFNTVVFKKDISDINKNHSYSHIKLQSEKNLKFINISTFYLYDDLFVNNIDENFNNFNGFCKKFDSRIIANDNWIFYKFNIIKYDNLNYPLFKIDLHINSEKLSNFSCFEFRKLILSFFSESLLWYILDNNVISNYFSKYITDVTNLKINNVSLKFKLPENIFIADRNYNKIKKNILKFRYNLFVLKELYKKISNFEKLDMNNYNIDLIKNRGELELDNLIKIISLYEEKLENFFEKIK